MNTASNRVWYWNCGGTGDGVTVNKRSVECNVLYTYCSVHGSRFLHPEGLHHLEDVHYSSILHRSMVVAMAQDMPERLTVY